MWHRRPEEGPPLGLGEGSGESVGTCVTVFHGRVRGVWLRDDEEVEGKKRVAAIKCKEAVDEIAGAVEGMLPPVKGSVETGGVEVGEEEGGHDFEFGLEGVAGVVTGLHRVLMQEVQR